VQDAQHQLSGNDNRGNGKFPMVAGEQVAQIAGLGEVKLQIPTKSPADSEMMSPGVPK